jgi:uncharacterized C2H2 Zn-finger protein
MAQEEPDEPAQCGECGQVFSLQDEAVEFVGDPDGKFWCNCPACGSLVDPEGEDA